MLRIRIWRIVICDAIEWATALKCQKQLMMSSILNLGGRESLEIAVNIFVTVLYNTLHNAFDKS